MTADSLRVPPSGTNNSASCPEAVVFTPSDESGPDRVEGRVLRTVMMHICIRIQPTNHMQDPDIHNFKKKKKTPQTPFSSPIDAVHKLNPMSSHCYGSYPHTRSRIAAALWKKKGGRKMKIFNPHSPSLATRILQEKKTSIPFHSLQIHRHTHHRHHHHHHHHHLFLNHTHTLHTHTHGKKRSH
jgi:hypothetical protein